MAIKRKRVCVWALLKSIHLRYSTINANPFTIIRENFLIHKWMSHRQGRELFVKFNWKVNTNLALTKTMIIEREIKATVYLVKNRWLKFKKTKIIGSKRRTYKIWLRSTMQTRTSLKNEQTCLQNWFQNRLKIRWTKDQVMWITWMHLKLILQTKFHSLKMTSWIMFRRQLTTIKIKVFKSSKNWMTSRIKEWIRFQRMSLIQPLWTNNKECLKVLSALNK